MTIHIKNAMQAPPQSSSSHTPFTLSSTRNTLTGLPPNSIIVHSTNCFGTWGAGVALAINDLFPNADAVYASHCDSFRPSPQAWPNKDGLLGTCLLIAPQEGDKLQGVWIACLFTSYGYGRPTKKKGGKDTKAKIVEQTRTALRDLRKQLEVLGKPNGSFPRGDGGGEEKSVQGTEVMDIYSPKFNSGSFGVKWEETEVMIGDIFRGWQGKWYVLSPPKE